MPPQTWGGSHMETTIRPTGNAPHRVLERFEMEMERLHLSEQRQGFWSGLKPSLATLEERQSQPRLRVFDHTADVGLRNTQESSGSADGAGLHHRPEIFDLAQAKTDHECG